MGDKGCRGCARGDMVEFGTLAPGDLRRCGAEAK
jgi:hypothetical protein